MKLSQIFKTKQPPSTQESKGYYGGSENRQNAFFEQLYRGFSDSIVLPDWSASADRESLYRIFADKDKSNHAVYSIVSSMASAVGEIMEYAEFYDQNDKVIKNHWALDLLKDPNDAQSMQDFAQTWVVNLLTVGDTFVYGQETAMGLDGRTFGSMYVMPSHMVQILSGGLMSPIKGYQIQGKGFYGGQKPALSPENVMFCRLPNPSGETFYGLSPLVSVLKDIEIIENGKKRTNAAFKNGGVSNIIFPDIADYGLTPLEKDKFEKELNRRHGGNYNKVVTSPVGVARLGDTPADLALLQANEASVQAVCNAYGYPIDLLFGRSTFSNMGEARKMRYELAVPYANMFLAKFSRWTKITTQGLRSRINTDEIESLKPDPNTIISAMNSAGTTINERREYMGYPPAKGEIYDQITYPINTSFGDEGNEMNKPIPETTNQDQKQ